MRLFVTFWGRAALVIAAVLTMGIIVAQEAEARGGRGFSFGSRGFKTFSRPPATRTAPKAVKPIQRSTTKPGAASTAQGGRGVAANSSRSRFGTGFGGLLMGGLLGAGLFGLLSGAGFFSGLGSLAGILGFLLQAALIGGLIWLALAFFGSRRAATAGAGTGSGPTGIGSPMRRSSAAYRQRAHGPTGGFGGHAAASVAERPLEIGQADYDAFERLLRRIQDAYGQEDETALRAMLTPEMAGYMSEEIAENRQQNVHNLVSDTKLLQGDLAEAWSEPDAEYATVAMRFELLDTTVERGTGRVLAGNPDTPEEITEVWTFTRRLGSGAGGWKLCAIQQVE